MLQAIAVKSVFKLLVGIGGPLLLAGGLFVAKQVYDSAIRKSVILETQLAGEVAEKLRFKKDSEKKQAINVELRRRSNRTQQLVVEANLLATEREKRARDNQVLADALNCELPDTEYSELCEIVQCKESTGGVSETR